MGNVVPFHFENTAIRVVLGDDGESWFVGKDVAGALGYADPTTAIRSQGRHRRGSTVTPSKTPPQESNDLGIQTGQHPIKVPPTWLLPPQT